MLPNIQNKTKGENVLTAYFFRDRKRAAKDGLPMPAKGSLQHLPEISGRVLQVHTLPEASLFCDKLTFFHTPVVAEETRYLNSTNTIFQHIYVEY